MLSLLHYISLIVNQQLAVILFLQITIGIELFSKIWAIADSNLQKECNILILTTTLCSSLDSGSTASTKMASETFGKLFCHMLKVCFFSLHTTQFL